MDKDANDQIKKALDLLDSKNVATNLEEILNRYVFEAPDIDYQCEQGLSNDLLQYKIRRFFETSLKRFKNGSWLDDLNYLVKSFKDYEQQKIQIKNETIKKTLANNIDLDPIDW